MKKFMITIYGIVIGLIISLGYSLYIYVTNPDWGDLAAFASFIVIFPGTILITIIVQLVYLIRHKKR